MHIYAKCDVSLLSRHVDCKNGPANPIADELRNDVRRERISIGSVLVGPMTIRLSDTRMEAASYG